MRLADTRPPFAGLAKLPEEALASLPTPCYLLDEGQLRRNGEILLGVQQRTGCKILLAQKAFSNFDLYPLLAPYLAGTEASGLYESRLGKEELPDKENHVFCAAFRADEFDELLCCADHIVFNSPRQLKKFGPAAKAAGKSVGLRINPECSTQEGHAIYDPCAPGSRLGTTRAQWDAAAEKDSTLLSLLDGLHFHTLCEQDADALAATLDAVEALRAAGAEVLGIVSIFTYGMKKGLERLADAGVRNVSLTDLDTIAREGADAGYIAETDVARLLAFRDDPSDETWITKGGTN